MRKCILLLLLLSFVTSLAQAQFYRKRFETGDTLVAATADTTWRCPIYDDDNTDNARPIRPVVYIIPTDINNAGGHYWLQVDVEVTDRALGYSDNGWARIGTYKLSDWRGLNETAKYPFRLPLPILESYACRYFRLILHYPYGASSDSTGYECVYCADISGNMYNPPPNRYKIIPHTSLFNSASAQAINGKGYIQSRYFDSKIETSPGVYQIADRCFIMAAPGTKADDDSITVYLRSYFHGYTTGDLFTLTIPIDSETGIAKVSDLTLNGGDGFVGALSIWAYNESELDEDTTEVYLEVHLECDP